MFTATQYFPQARLFGFAKNVLKSTGISLLLFSFTLSSHSSPLSEQKNSSVIKSSSRSTATTTIGITLVIPPREALSVLDEDMAGIDLKPKAAKGFNFEFNDGSSVPSSGDKALASLCAALSPVLSNTITTGTADKSVGLYASDKKSQGLINYCQRQQVLSSASDKETKHDLTVFIAPI